MKLNKILLIFSFCLGIALLTSCSKEKQTKIEIPSIYEQADSLEVYGMINAYLNHVKAGEFDQAVEMLSELDHDTICPLTDQLRQSCIAQYNTFPLQEYVLVGKQWEETDPIIFTYNMVFGYSDDGSTPYFYKTALSPVRRNGKWYLTLYQKLSYN